MFSCTSFRSVWAAVRPYRKNTTVEKHGYGFCKVTHRFLRGLHLVPYRMFDPREDNIQKQRGNPKMLGCKMAAKQSESKGNMTFHWHCSYTNARNPKCTLCVSFFFNLLVIFSYVISILLFSYYEIYYILFKLTVIVYSYVLWAFSLNVSVSQWLWTASVL